MLGYAGGEAVFSRQAEWLAAVHPDDRGFIDQVLKRLGDGEKVTSSAFYRLRAKDGAYRWIQSRAATLHDDQHRVVRVFGLNGDMTE